MSIAVSAVVRPSRLLRALVCLLSLAGLAVTLLLVLGLVGDVLSALARFVLLLLCCSAAAFGFYHGITLGKTLHIDISGSGRISVRTAGKGAVDVTNSGTCKDDGWPHLEQSRGGLSLLPSSTLWPHLLVLRLKANGGEVRVVCILPDCLPRESFRALAASCRWLAMRSQDRSAGS